MIVGLIYKPMKGQRLLLDDFSFYIEYGKVKYWNKNYSFADLQMDYNEKYVDLKIGTIDFETFGLEGNGLGSLHVYACGFAMSSGDDNFSSITGGKTEGSVLNDIWLRRCELFLTIWQDLAYTILNVTFI